MESDTSDRFGTTEMWEQSSLDDDFEQRYDDYEDLFSNETDSTVGDPENEKEIGMYLEMEPSLQKQIAQLIMLRRHLDSLQEKLNENELMVSKSREELNACRTRLAALESEHSEIVQDAAAAEEKNNVASLKRLIGKRDKLQIEIDNEKKVEIDIQKALQKAELSLSQVQIEQKHYIGLSEQVIEKEEAVTQHKQKMAKHRLAKAEKSVKIMRQKYKEAERDLQNKVEALKSKKKEAAETAMAQSWKAKEFLKHSLAKVRERERQVAESTNLETTRKADTIINLKNNIALNRENLKALQARDASLSKKKEIAEKIERKAVLNQGGNPEQVLLHRKKLKEYQQAKHEFEAKQKLNKTRIVGNILNEEESIRKRKKQQPALWENKELHKSKIVGPIPKPPLHAKIALTENDEPIFLEHEKYFSRTPGQGARSGLDVEEKSTNEDLPALPIRERKSTHRIEEEEILTQPEFEGMWDQKQKVHKQAPKDDIVPNQFSGTKMEQDILRKTLSKHRDGIITKQVAAGREFKGQPFNSKPEVIHFKDLDVGKTYKKKVLITNVSYTINFIKMIGLSEHLKDFIKIEFHPPGNMSAGMSCDMHVTFKPMINEDLTGEVIFLAQTGRFSIPLKCTTKKCDLSIDINEIDFGVQVVGETIRRSVTLVNKGALGTRFEFVKIPDRPPTAYTMETSLGRLTSAGSPGFTANDASEPQNTATFTRPDTEKKSKKLFQSVPQTADITSRKESRGVSLVADVIEGTEKVEYNDKSPFPVDEDEIILSRESDYPETTTDELKVGEVMGGEIDAFSSVRLDIVFTPSIPGDVQAVFQLTFADANSQSLEIKVSAVAIDVPVWLERKNVDLKICMYDRLYQEQIHLHNRSSIALRLNFEVPKELRGHMELLPKTGYIQAKSKFTAQLKFLPRYNLAEDAGDMFDPETGIVECPMIVRVADQTRPVPFVVNAIVTPSDLEFDQTEVDFGHCGIYESVVHTVKLTNHSILPQLFGFVGIPDFVDVQPNDGFGRIFPLETIELDLIMNAKRARDYDFTLVCRSGINRDFPIRCKATGVHPPLELSHQVIHFGATAIDDVSTSIVYVINSHTSANEFTHPVPRIGKGEIVPVGPTSFEFVVPENAPVSITPTVGTVEPGKKQHITVEFSPKLNDEDIRREACRVLQQEKERILQEEQERLNKEAEEAISAKSQEEEKAAKGKKTPKTPAKPKAGDPPPKSHKSSAKSAEKKEVEVTPDMIDENSDEYKAAYAYLLRAYKGSFQSFTIPCFVASGKCSETVEPSTLTYNEANTLFLEVHCPVVKPPVVIISNHGHSVMDFGQVSIGQNQIKPISIQNISDQPVELTISVLDTNGPFQMLNAFRTLRPDETHTMLVSFTPTEGKVFHEVLKIYGRGSALDVCLTGRGVTPVIKLEPEDSKINLGHVLQGESATALFTLENLSSLAVKYAIQMDSLSLLKHEKLQQLPDFVRRNNEPRKTLVGTQNKDGSCVFDCVPCMGEIKTGEKHEIQVTFNPDHESLHFSDGARVILFSTEEAHVVHLTGTAHKHMMYVEGNDPLDVSIESLAGDSHSFQAIPDSPLPMKNILLSFKSLIDEEGFSTSTRDLDIGCVKSIAFAGKKAGEWTVDNLQMAHMKGFTVEPARGVVDIDTTKPITFTWTPREDCDPSVPLTTSVHLILKGDVTLNYNVILTGLVHF